MAQFDFKSEIIPTVFAAMVLTAIYINLEILMNQTFYQIFEGNLEVFPDIFVVFIISLLVLIGIQYLIQQERSKEM